MPDPDTDVLDREDEDEQPKPVRSITGMAPIARAVQPARSITGMEPLVPPEPMPATITAPPMPIEKTTGPNISEDILAGKVAPPEWKDYKPQHVSAGRKILASLLGGMAGLNNPQLGAQTTRSIAYGPQLEKFNEAQQAYKDTLGEAELGEKTRAKEAETGLAEARAEALRNPVPKEGLTNDEQLFHDLTAGDNGKPRVNPETKQPYTALEAYQKISQLKNGTADEKLRDEMAKLGYNVSVDPNTKELSVSPITGFNPATKENEQERAISDWLGAHNLPDTPANRTKARQDLKEKPPQPQRELVEVPQTDGSTKLIEAVPGMILPKGAHKAGTKGEEATADEKRRADLAENMNENLDQLEEIANRRPDLFGPVAGRMTQLKGAVGTDDPDVAALGTIREQLGMAMVGAHAMRNAQHVSAAANAIINNFHNSPKAMLQAIKEARSSVGTFQEDVEHPRAPGTPREPGEEFTGKGPTVGTIEGGFQFKGGDPANKNNWKKVKEKPKSK